MNNFESVTEANIINGLPVTSIDFLRGIGLEGATTTEMGTEYRDQTGYKIALQRILPDKVIMILTQEIKENRIWLGEQELLNDDQLRVYLIPLGQPRVPGIIIHEWKLSKPETDTILLWWDKDLGDITVDTWKPGDSLGIIDSAEEDMVDTITKDWYLYYVS